MSILLSTVAVERSTYVIEFAFTDEEGTAVIPTSATWTLTDTAGAVINSRSAVAIAPLSSAVSVVLSGADLALSSGEVKGHRVFTVEAVYTSDIGAGLPLKAAVRFNIENLIAVS